MDKLNKKTFTTAANVTYTYWSSPATSSRPTLLLLHGNPDSASLWSGLINNFLLPNGYGILAPDLIGFGDTEKPWGLEHYRVSSICQDLIAILDQEGLDRVIPVGHDFGAFLASRFTAFHQNRTSGLITLGTAYVPPSPYPFDFEQLRAMQEKYLGYCQSWYFPLFTSERGSELIDAHVEEMFTGLHGGDEQMKEVCCVEGGIEKWLLDPASASKEVLAYARDASFRAEWVDRMKRNGFRAPLDWYKAVVQSLDLQEEREALEAGGHVVNVPYLFVAALKDPLAPVSAVQGPMSQGMLPNATQKEVEASHWCMLEKPVEVGQAIVEWLGEQFP